MVAMESVSYTHLDVYKRQLYDEREPLYERYAEITVNVDDLSITAAARKVADALR